MKKYVLREPFTIEAIQWTGDNELEVKGIQFTDNSLHIFFKVVQFYTFGETSYVKVGDWIIKDSNGMLHPCEDSIFQKKYKEDIDLQHNIKTK